MVTINIVSFAPGNNAIAVRIDGRDLRVWRSSAVRGDFDALHADAHRVAQALAGEFLAEAVCRWCELRSGEGGIR